MSAEEPGRSDGSQRAGADPHGGTETGTRGEASAARHGRLTGALRRTPVAVWRDDATDRAAALTYYAVLAIFPALLVTVCSIGLAGPDASGKLADQITALVPAQSRLLVHGALREMAEQRSAAWLLASFGTVGALWSASSYLGVFRRALHSMHGVVDHRPPWRTAPRIALTACALLALLVTSAFTLVLTGEAAGALGRMLGMDSAVSLVWNALKWPLLLALAAVLVLIVFRTGPPGTRRLRRALPGGMLAVALWLLTSAGFTVYTAHAGTYNRLYGSLAGAIVFLVWLWVTNLSLLAGAHFNAELSRGDTDRGDDQVSVSPSLPAAGRPATESRPAAVGHRSG
ncbi:YihY/virulence factor BrkB family protein [Streptomyces sp. NPDC006923]|uniref:YihY/virulence factor BrkB family protein n=1 Tax=Streptomyces sp. NPDC006923 TaxID=3155355 RepID=UPI0033D231CE